MKRPKKAGELRSEGETGCYTEEEKRKRTKREEKTCWIKMERKRKLKRN